MSTSVWLYVALTVTFAGLLVAYAANAWRALDGSRSGESRWGAVALAPARAWRLGARALPITFGALVIVYALLWLSTRWVIT